MLRDVFYYGNKPNVHPREKFAKNLADARKQSTTIDFWIINEFCDYKDFDWDFDFEFLPDEDVWAQDHNNVWPSQHQKDSGTWLCSKNESDVIIYRNDVNPIKRKNVKFDCWVLYDIIDETKFDFSWHPDPTDPPYIYVWGNQWVSALYKPTVEYIVPGAVNRKYMDQVAFVLPEWDRWIIIEDIDKSSFDFTWRPDPKEPNLIYVFGNEQYDAIHMPTIEYHMPNATERKYVVSKSQSAKLKSNSKKFTHLENAELKNYSWRPHPNDPPYIYVWGNQWNKPEDKISIQYEVEGATEYKYMEERSIRKPCMDNWEIPDNVDVTNFDFSWEPSPADNPYIYQFGTQWQKDGGPRYVIPGATEIKYVDIQTAKALPTKDNWVIPEHIDVTDFDFSWHPDTVSPKYIYQFGTQWALTGGPKYVMEGATEVKYMDNPVAKALPNRENWVVPTDVDASSFDFSWHPYVEDKPYIYVFGTQHQKTGGPKYMTPGVDGTSATKYIDRRILKSTRLPNKKRFAILNNYKIKNFDWSWHPDDTVEPYIYVFGNTQYPGEIMPTIEYRMQGATKVKYVSEVVAELAPDLKNWDIPEHLDCENFDFSWKPNPTELPYIYQFGTQWQKTGGPRYIVPGATEIKYVDTQKAKSVPYMRNNWNVPDNIDITDFDFSWHPDSTDEPYIYQFGTQWQKTGGPKFIVKGATEIKYVDLPVVKALPDKSKWQIPEGIDIDNFDFSWHPSTLDIEPYVYQVGTQWQKTGGPRYISDGVTDQSPIKYVDREMLQAKKLPNKDNWHTLFNYKIADFDYSWHPDETEEPYIYVFGNQYYPGETMPTIEYRINGAVKRKYINDVNAKLGPDKTFWLVPDNIDTTEFDFCWKPNPFDPPYIYKFGTQHQKTGGPEYWTPDATEIKYMDFQKAKALPRPNDKRWHVPTGLDLTDFDFSWHPDDTDKPYIYQFGTQWALTGGPRFVMPEATETKYIEEPIAKAAPNKTNWEIPDDIDIDDFDFSWHPYAEEDPYIYQFGTQHQKTGGPRYLTPGTDEMSATKFIDPRVLKAKKLPKPKNFVVQEGLSVKEFDYSWHPDVTDGPYIYIFGNTQYPAEIMPTVKYTVPGATKIKYVNDVKAVLAPNMKNWKIPDNIDINSFDFSWVPDPTSPPYIYEFATVWNSRGGPKYIVDGATEYKYIENIKAKCKPNKQNWEIPNNIDVSDFDFSWVPHPEAPPYIYQFGTLENDNDGPRYTTPDNNGDTVRLLRVYKEKQEITEIPKYYITGTLEKLVEEHVDEIFWAIRENIDYSNFDFTWQPNIEQARYVHVFGSPDSEITQTYFISGPMWKEGHKDFNFVEQDKVASEEYLAELFVQPDIFLVDRGNSETQERFEQLKARFTNVSKTRFLNSWVDTINRCINRSNTELCWILNSELDYSKFDFKYYPNPWQLKMVHVFGTQWSHWGTTFMVNRDTFAEDTKYVKIIEHLSNLNFVKERRAIATNNLYDVIVIDHGNKECEKVVASLQSRMSGKKISVVKYEDSYLETIKKIINGVNAKKEHFIWIVSSVCNYSEFDLTYICDPFAKDSLHVFPSDRQKFGDTFLLDLNKAKEFIETLDLLQKYPKVNYNQAMRVKRIPPPIIKTLQDTHIESINTDFDFSYAIFQTEEVSVTDTEPMNLWAQDTKDILITSTGGTRIIVPKEAKQYVKDQLYDYPYIKTASKLIDSKPLDIVFLSNGEKCADENYEHLLAVTKGLKNRVVRVDGVNGRVDAYQAAVKASETNWAFTVFAKLKVDNRFDWGWQPDRLQIPKHYIFHAKNPVNGLIYGHQGMIAYNKALTLNNFGDGLDFTLDDPHETIEILSGIATFNTDNYSTWRTAFREVIKLKSDYTDISQERLQIWLTKAKGKFAKACLQGSNDAVEYYDSVSGDIDQLKLSYEWNWLKEYYDKKYK